MIKNGRYQSLIFMLFALLIAASLRLTTLTEVPPGVHYDEAANGVLAADIGLRGDRPVFISSYTGKEVLFFYLAGGLMRLLGDSVFTLRLTAAFVGLITVTATYWLGREMLRQRAMALLAAALLATSFWQLLFSHLGFRAITQPLLQALTVAALLRGLRRSDWRWLTAAGLFLGLTGYTYLAARLFPALLLLAALPIILNRKSLRRRWWQVLLVLAVALLVLAPLLLYFVEHPDAFWVRIGQVAPGSGQNPSLIESYLKSLGMLFLRGDPYMRLNLPQLPLFDWLWGSLLVVGWVVLLVRWRRLAADWQRSAALLLLLAPLVMILPTALATGEIIPSNLRAIGLAPFIFFLPAVGVQRLANDLDRRIQGLPADWLVLAVGLTWLTVGGLQTERAYFTEWATRADLFYETDGDLTAVATYLDALNTKNKTIYVAAAHYQHPTLAFLSQKYGQIKWLPQSQALVFPPERTAVYIFPHSSPLPAWAKPYLATAVQLNSPRDSQGDPIFTVYEQESADLTITNPLNINFGGAIILLGYSTEPGHVNETIPLRLIWRVESQPPADFTPFVHLEDGWGYRWGQVETFAYPAAQWSPGEIIVQQVAVPVPPGTPPGAAYRLRVGLFDQATGERLPQLDSDGRYAGDSYLIAGAGVIAGPPPEHLPQPPYIVDESAVEGLRLLGYERGASTAFTGETITAALWWLAGQPQSELTTRLELHPASGPGRILTNTQPVHNTIPFAIWPTPIFLIDHVHGRIPDNMLPGTYRLQMRLFDGQNEMVYETNLGTLTIEKSQRLFDPPAMQNRLDTLFGNEISLLGYDLTGSSENQFNLTLVWQAETTPADDYTVFVHLLDQNGVCCLWQADVMPQQNQYPTSRWQPGEVVVDSYQITVPEGTAPGEYVVEVGLYLAGNGRRLQAITAQSGAGDAILFPLTITE